MYLYFRELALDCPPPPGCFGKGHILVTRVVVVGAEAIEKKQRKLILIYSKKFPPLPPPQPPDLIQLGRGASAIHSS